MYFTVWYTEHTGWLEREAVSRTRSENCQDAPDPPGISVWNTPERWDVNLKYRRQIALRR